MNILREYRTITEASDDTNISIGNISKNLTVKEKLLEDLFGGIKIIINNVNI
jgi:hypothetical protein